MLSANNFGQLDNNYAKHVEGPSLVLASFRFLGFRFWTSWSELSSQEDIDI